MIRTQSTARQCVIYFYNVLVLAQIKWFIRTAAFATAVAQAAERYASAKYFLHENIAWRTTRYKDRVGHTGSVRKTPNLPMK